MKTKIVGYMMIALAILNAVKDLLDGGPPFDLNFHFNSFMAALAGAGIIFLRNGVAAEGQKTAAKVSATAEVVAEKAAEKALK